MLIDLRKYPVHVHRLGEEEGGGYLAVVPDFPGCMGDGETEVAAIENARAAVVSWIDEARRLGRFIPDPNQPKC